MSDSYDLGKEGEEDAVNFLIKEGYTIVERNWYFKKGEIDIIAETNEYLVMVEVKTRYNDDYGRPEEFVSRTQQNHIIKVASRYLELYPTDKDVRFDIIAILQHPKFDLLHIPEAFYP